MDKAGSFQSIGIAQRAWKSGKRDKAIKFLKKSIRLWDNQEARQLLEQYTSQSPPSAQQAPNNVPTEKSPHVNANTNTNANGGDNHQNNTNTKSNTRDNNNNSDNDGKDNDQKIDWGSYFNVNNDNGGGSGGGGSSSSNTNGARSPKSSFRSSSSPQQQQANRSNSNSARNNSEASRSSSRLTADEEVKMIRKVLRSKDYYDMLGVSHDVGEVELKKKYRKLALKLHPDRNKAPGAEEAFKKLSSAYDCLRDNQKRRYYDSHGTEAPQSRGGMNGQFQQMTPDDIIRMFFGGDFHGNGGTHTSFMFGGPGRRNSTQRRNRPSSDGDGDNESRGGILFTLMQLLPLLFVMFSMFLPTFFSSLGDNSSSNLGNSHGSSWEGQHFGLTKSRIFTREEETSLGTKFFIRNTQNQWGFNPIRNRAALEDNVEVSYLNYLIIECNSENKLYSDNLETVKSNDISNKKRVKMLNTMQRGLSNGATAHSAAAQFYNSKYQNGNGNGKFCAKLDEYLENLS